MTRLLWWDRSRAGRIGVAIGLGLLLIFVISAVAGSAAPESDAAPDSPQASAAGAPITTAADPESTPSTASTTASTTAPGSAPSSATTDTGSTAPTTVTDATLVTEAVPGSGDSPTTTIAPTPFPTPTSTTTTTAPARAPPSDGSTAVSTEGALVSDLLAQLRTEPERPAGYDRDLFPHWITTRGCTTRNHVLIRDAAGTATVGDGCRVTGGRWHSPFDDVTVTSPGSLDIDHYVPLAEAWRSGADAWDADTRRRYANDLEDPRSLIAVTASSNRSKSDSDPADWLPPHRAYRCHYVGTWVAVKHRWNLAVDSRERTAITTVLSGCGQLRTSPTPPASISSPPATSVATTTTTPTSTPTTTAPTTTAPALPSTQCVNINTASVEDLERIIHIGPSRAAEILNLRPFSSVKDLTRVTGIGPSRLADIEAEGLACT